MDVVIQVRNRGVITLPADFEKNTVSKTEISSAWLIWMGFLFSRKWCPWSLSWPAKISPAGASPGPA